MDWTTIIILIAWPLLVKMAENERITSKLQKKKGVTH